MTDTAKLKAAALAATPGPWRRAATVFNGITCGPFSLTNEKVLANVAEKANSEFIAAANPAAVLELIAALEAKNAQISELDERLLRYAGIATRRAEHVAELEERVAELESRTVTLPRPACTYADHSYPAYSEKQVVELLESLGINLETGGE